MREEKRGGGNTHTPTLPQRKYLFPKEREGSMCFGVSFCLALFVVYALFFVCFVSIDRQRQNPAEFYFSLCHHSATSLRHGPRTKSSENRLMAGGSELFPFPRDLWRVRAGGSGNFREMMGQAKPPPGRFSYFWAKLFCMVILGRF